MNVRRLGNRCDYLIAPCLESIMGRHAKDHAGTKYGKLTVLPHRGDRIGKNLLWPCRCECGNETFVISQNIGRTKSCGCQSTVSNLTHGKSKTKEYRAWRAMVYRCTKPNYIGWKYYGGRGIRVCDEWRHNFAAFYQHIGPKPTPSHTVDRIDNDGNYDPGNVRWATRKEQATNRRPRRRVA